MFFDVLQNIGLFIETAFSLVYLGISNEIDKYSMRKSCVEYLGKLPFQ